MGRVGTDCKPRATNGLLEGDTGHFRRWHVGNKMRHHGGDNHGGEVLINNPGMKYDGNEGRGVRQSFPLSATKYSAS